jgi:hypothetical protein
MGDRIEEIASELPSSLPTKIALCGHGTWCDRVELVRRAPERVIHWR